MGVNVPVMSNDDCDTYLYYRGSILDGMICMGYLESGGYDSCQVSHRQKIIRFRLDSLFKSFCQSVGPSHYIHRSQKRYMIIGDS